MSNHPRFIFLADDDDDDRFLFQEALNEITLPTKLSSVRDGEQLMDFLAANSLPDVLFLDLNMPRKDGFQCLIEIKKNEKFKKLPVIIFSTSFQPDAVDKLYENGAQYYIRKPSNFEHFKKVILHAILLITTVPSANGSGAHRPPKEKFVLEPELIG
jgi:CheY-like chemotaxis protein